MTDARQSILQYKSLSTARRIALRLADEDKHEINKKKESNQKESIIDDIICDRRNKQPIKVDKVQSISASIITDVARSNPEIPKSISPRFRLEKVSNLTYKGENPQSEVVFLLEGLRKDLKVIEYYRHSNSSGRLFAHTVLPEFYGAMNWAMINHCPMFDPIVSYDCPTVIAEVLEKTLKLSPKKADETQKRMVLSLCQQFNTMRTDLKSLQKMITVIRQAFIELQIQGKIKEIPSWADLNVYKYIQLKNQYIKKYCGGNMDSFSRLIVSSGLDGGLYSFGFAEIYNRISRARLINYLISHPKVKTIYAMVGKYHVYMMGPRWGDINLNSLQPIKLNPEDYDHPGLYSHVQMVVEERRVEVHMFGGMHGRFGQYNKFKAVAKYKLEEPKGLEKTQANAEEIRLLLNKNSFR